MSARSSPGLRSSPSSSASSRSPSSTLNSNAYDRLRFLLDALTKPVQLPILHQQRAEERLSAASSSSSPSPALSSLSAPSALLRSQARLKAGYVDWDDGLSQVKAFVRERDDGAARVWALLSERLRVRNSESRLLAFFVVDALFVRSAKFRTLALDGLHGLLEHCAGIAASSSTLAPVVAELPPPAEVAKGLKDECVAAVTRWRARYGGAYRVLELGYKYLVDALGLEHVVAAQQREGDERKAAAAHEAEVLRVRFQRMREEWKKKKADVDDCIATIDGCVDVLFPPEDDWTAETAQAETEEKKREEVVEQVIIESGPQEAGSAASTASADVVWEDDEDKEQKAPRAPEAGTVEANGQATSAAVLADDDAGQDEHEQWEDEFLRTGGSGEVWGDGSGASDGGGDDDAPEGDVGRLVAEAGLGSRGYQLEIDFDSDLGRMENEGRLGRCHRMRCSAQLRSSLTSTAVFFRQPCRLRDAPRLLPADPADISSTGQCTRSSSTGDPQPCARS